MRVSIFNRKNFHFCIGGYPMTKTDWLVIDQD
jgi:hypothetical protein